MIEGRVRISSNSFHRYSGSGDIALGRFTPGGAGLPGWERLMPSPEALDAALAAAEALGKLGTRSRVLAVPPDITRFHSQAGWLTRCAFEYYGERLTDILPAVGTHDAMTETEIASMFGDLPRGLFRRHGFRHDVSTLGEVPAALGEDGLQGSQEIALAGGRVIVQDEGTSTVWEMPGRVVEVGLADAVLPIGDIAAELVRRTAPRAHGEIGAAAS